MEGEMAVNQHFQTNQNIFPQHKCEEIRGNNQLRQTNPRDDDPNIISGHNQSKIDPLQ